MRADTAAFIAFHAATRPQAAALIQDGTTVTYGRFARDLDRATRLLAAFGLEQGAVVAVELADTYLHWLLLLACERLGLATGSYVAGETPVPAPLLAMARLVLHREPLPAAPGGEAVRLDNGFAARLRAASDAPLSLPAVSWRAGQRFRRSSGTTGAPKLMLATVAQQDASLRNHLYSYDGGVESRLLIFNNFTIGAMYTGVTVMLRLGGAVIVERRRDPLAALLHHRPTHLRLLVAEAAAILDRLPADYRKPDELTVLLTGSTVAPALYDRLLDRLATRVGNFYASNEALSFCWLDRDGIGAVMPGVALEIDEEGAVRARTPGLVDGYVGDAEASARMFRDGWFHPGDLAEWVGRRRLRLAGRVDDIIHLGTGKMLPADIEGMVRDAIQVGAVAVTALRQASGIDQVCIALVPEPGQDVSEAVAILVDHLPPLLGKVRLRVVPALPVGDTGKVKREALLALFADAG